MEQLFVKHKLYNSPKEMQKHLMNVTAKLRQQVLEDAALEDIDAVKNGIYDLVKKCHLEIVKFLKDKYKIEIKYDENNLPLEKLLFNKDKKTLNDRLDPLFKIYAIDKNDGLGSLWRGLELIMVTEMTTTVNKTLIAPFRYAKKHDIDLGYEFIYHVEYSGCDECNSYGGEFYDFEEAIEPPFHPGCQCSFNIVEEEVEADTVDGIIVDEDELEYY